MNKIDRLPPHSTEAEEGVLGCLLLDPNLLNDIAGKIGSSSFYNLRHKTIYDAMAEMFADRQPIDLITLQQKLKDAGTLEQVGGIARLSELQDSVPSAANLTYYLDIVQEKSILRKLLKTCAEVSGKVYSHEGSASDLLSEVEREILTVRPDNKSESHGIRAITNEAIGRIEQIFQLQGAIGGLSTGLPDLDKVTDGMHGGEMIVLAAFPSCGKTALALNIAMFNAFAGIPVAVASCEMMPKELVVRGVCAESKVNLYDIRDGHATEDDFTRMTVAAAKIASSPLTIENTNGYTIEELQAWARRTHQKQPFKLLVVDYLQLISNPRADKREQEVSSISKGLKSIAMEFNVPVLALSQLNDDGQLRESRAIGQDGDSIWKLDNDGEKMPHDQPIVCLIDKNRNGPVGKVRMMFRKQYTCFESVAKFPDELY